jgi:hypothetical protein
MWLLVCCLGWEHVWTTHTTHMQIRGVHFVVCDRANLHKNMMLLSKNWATTAMGNCCHYHWATTATVAIVAQGGVMWYKVVQGKVVQGGTRQGGARWRKVVQLETRPLVPTAASQSHPATRVTRQLGCPSNSHYTCSRNTLPIVTTRAVGMPFQQSQCRQANDHSGDHVVMSCR